MTTGLETGRARDERDVVRAGDGTVRSGDAGETGDEKKEKAVVEVCDVTKRYEAGGGTVVALSGVSLAFERGSITGILGTNGAGKTTLLKTILGLVTPTHGTVHVDGIDVFEESAAARRSVAAVLEGTRNVYWRLTPRENVAFFARLHGVPGRARVQAVEEIVDAVGLAERADVRVGDLSRGMKQRCALACALVRGAPVLVLDEPTLGLDRKSTADLLSELVDLVEREERTVVLSSHDTDVIERVCDRVVVIDGGRVVADGSIAELQAAFDTMTFTVTVAGELAPGNVLGIEESFEIIDWQRGHERTRFETALANPDDVYRLIEQLEEEGLALCSVERAESDLGRIVARIAAADGIAPGTAAGRPVATERERPMVRPE